MYAVKSRAEEFINYTDFFFAYTLIIPNMLYCSVFSALILFPKQSPFVRSLWIISEWSLFHAIELLATIAPASHKPGQELLWWWILFFSSLDQVLQALVFTVMTPCGWFSV